MWKTVTRFVEKLILKKFWYYKFYWAKLENKDGVFNCSFGKKYLENYSEEKNIYSLKCKKGSQGFMCREMDFLADNEEITF